MSSFEYDLALRAGRVLCPQSSRDAAGFVLVQGDRIADVDGAHADRASKILEFPDAVVVPGLVDLHAHPAVGGSKYGIVPDQELLPRGVTTALSQGDAGADQLDDYRRHTIRESRTRVRLAINLSAPGESMPDGCFENADWADVGRCVTAIESAGDDVWGIAVNVSEIACGATDPQLILSRGIEAADRTDRPLLFGMRNPADWPMEDQLARLRPGDVVTYCFREEPFGIVQNGKIPDCVRRARQRGVLFDVGHGMASFDFAVAEAALAEDFPPDTISSDQYARHIGSQPPHDLLRTASKLIAAGMSEADALAAVTARPAEILGLQNEIGSLTPGACADLTVIRCNVDAAPLVDTRGDSRPGGCWEAILTVRGGTIVEPKPPKLN